MISSAVCVLDRDVAIGAIGLAQPGVENPQIVVDFGHGADSRARRVPHLLLFDGDGRRQAFDVVELRLVHLADELPGVGGGFRRSAAALRHRSCPWPASFCPPAHAAARRSSSRGDFDVDALQIVLPAADTISFVEPPLSPLPATAVSANCQRPAGTARAVIRLVLRRAPLRRARGGGSPFRSRARPFAAIRPCATRHSRRPLRACRRRRSVRRRRPLRAPGR